MKLTDLQPAKGSRKPRKTVGRGFGSGHGKTSTRGANGQGQRAGGGVRPGFEGGQMPLFRRTPKKKHFFVPGQKTYAILNLRDLADLPAGTEVSGEWALENGLLSKLHDGLRVLGNGDLSVGLTIKASHVSEAARQKIEAAGGKVEIV